MKGNPVNTNDNQSHQVLQEWRDENGRVDLTVARSGNYDVVYRDDVTAALLDEVEQLRADRELMAAVVDAINLPAPSTYVDEQPYLRLLERRAGLAMAAVGIAGEDAKSASSMARILRKQVAQSSITYKTAGGES